MLGACRLPGYALPRGDVLHDTCGEMHHEQSSQHAAVAEHSRCPRKSWPSAQQVAIDSNNGCTPGATFGFGRPPRLKATDRARAARHQRAKAIVIRATG